MEEQILDYFGRRSVATLDHLVRNLGAPENEVSSAVDALERRGWLARGWARFMESPEITLFTLTDVGKQELERRQALSPSSEGPVELSRT